MMEGFQLMYESGLMHVFAFVFGAVVGSFLNVVIHRWPLGLSIVKPASHCPSCERPIPWYWNIPVLSFILLRGECRFCGARISPRYLIVELVTGLWAVAMLIQFGPTVSALAYFAFGASLLAASLIDLEHMLLPDAVTLGLIPIGLGVSFLPRHMAGPWPISGYESVAGALVGAGAFAFVLVVFKLMTGREGMGLGDVKLMGAIGSFIGYQGIPAQVLVAGMAGIAGWLVSMYAGRGGRDAPVPFGPALSLGALVVVAAREWMERNWIIIEWVR